MNNISSQHSAYSSFLHYRENKIIRQLLNYEREKINMKLIVNFYNVEHGSCTHIITPNGKHILVDVGSKANKSIVKYIKEKYFPYGGSIDELIITHPHEDHVWGIPDMYTFNFTPRILWREHEAFPITAQLDTYIHQEIMKKANKMNADYSFPVAQNDDVLSKINNGGVDIEIIRSLNEKKNKKDLNTFSPVIIISYNSFKFILTGDNPATILNSMIENNVSDIKSKISNAHVLLAPHHGRSGEFCKDFFDIVNPQISIISDKTIEHETQEESANLYKGRGITFGDKTRYVLSTRNDGNISFEVQNNSGTVNINNGDY